MPQSCTGSRALLVPGQPQAAWIAQRDMGRDKSHSERRDWASWREQRGACVLLREQLSWQLCSLGCWCPARPWHCAGGRSILLSGEDLIPSQQQRHGRQKAPGQLQGSPWLPCPGSEEAAWFGLGSNLLWLSRNEGDCMAVPWELVALGISCHAHPGLGSISPFFLRCAALLHHLGFTPIALSM